MLKVGADNVDLWLSFDDEISDEQLLSAYETLLDSGEKHRNSQFYFAKDRRRDLVTRALVRTVLSRYVPIAPHEWTFVTNEHGRPEIANAKPNDIKVVFNVSHTDGLIALAVSTHRALGVDVENICVRHPSIDIANRFFAPSEVATLVALPSNRQPKQFFEYWTFKESYIKARGMGLYLPLCRFSFHYPCNRVVVFTVDPSLEDTATRWQFWQLQPTAEHLLAVCAERVGRSVPRLVVRKAIPCAGDEVFPLEILRISEP